jgi:hypothetical protein
MNSYVFAVAFAGVAAEMTEIELCKSKERYSCCHHHEYECAIAMNFI